MSLQGVGSIYFAGEAFIENQSLSMKKYDALVEKGILVKKAVPIDRYFRSEIRERFNFEDNGFEFVTLDQKTIEVLRSFADMPLSDDHKPLEKVIGEQFRLFLTDWGRKQGISFDIVVPVTALLYRHTTKDLEYKKGEGTARVVDPIGMAHTDLSDEGFSNFLLGQSLSTTWSLQEILQDNSLRLDDFEVSEVVNLWAPLNERPTLNTLAVMDISTIQNPSEELKLYKLDGYHQMNTIRSMPHQRWVIQEDMTCLDGDALVFNSRKTVHAGVDIEKEIECDDFRHSFDRKYAFLHRRV